MSDKRFNIGPGALAQAGTASGPSFALASPDFVALQTYVEGALALPKTKDEFQTFLGKGAPSDLTDFNPLIDTYKSMFDASTTWKDKTFPETVKLASDVYEYGHNKAPIFYKPILPLAEILTISPDNAEAKAKLKAILDNLQQSAQAMADRAKGAVAGVKTFADSSQLDYNKLVVNDGGGLFARYNKKYGETSDDVQKLTKDVAEQRRILKEANDEYDHDVIVAATTPTYAWVGLIGLVAAAIVAGIYGKKATDALNRARAAEDKIATLTDKLTANANVMNALHLSTFSITNISLKLGAALPVIQKIQGVWSGIADDLGAIVKLIDQDIRKVPPIIMDLGVEEAIKSWDAVAKAADNYRTHAFVKVSPAASMEAWKLDRMYPVASVSPSYSMFAVA
ncbi:MAG TPA: alpha-xenorhabdolysin family binary toxin subunit A [Thermoanaerobaculia bacterium]|nr:alpha-xenorhabdolysin family binary toxin subunit A [Thermoanaerobaculia bacterium]